MQKWRGVEKENYDRWTSKECFVNITLEHNVEKVKGQENAKLGLKQALQQCLCNLMTSKSAALSLLVSGFPPSDDIFLKDLCRREQILPP